MTLTKISGGGYYIFGNIMFSIIFFGGGKKKMKKIFIMICVIMLICVSPNIIMASTESNSLMEDTPQQDIYNQDTLVKNISTNQEDSQTNISMTNELDDLSQKKNNKIIKIQMQNR